MTRCEPQILDDLNVEKRLELTATLKRKHTDGVPLLRPQTDDGDVVTMENDDDGQRPLKRTKMNESASPTKKDFDAVFVLPLFESSKSEKTTFPVLNSSASSNSSLPSLENDSTNASTLINDPQCSTSEFPLIENPSNDDIHHVEPTESTSSPVNTITSNSNIPQSNCAFVSSSDSDISHKPISHLSARQRRKRAKKKPPSAPAICKYCEAVFVSIYARDQHVSTAHPTTHKCSVVGCSYRSGIKSFMRRHERVVHGPNALKCPILGCTGAFVKRNLARHVREYHKERQSEAVSTLKLPKVNQKCDYCDFSSRHQIKYENHVLDEHLTGINCPVGDCGANISASTIQSHFAENHANVAYFYKPGEGITLVESSEDGNNAMSVSVSDTDTDVEYVSVQSAQKVNFTCAQCNKSCNNRTSLRRHVARVHTKSYKQHAPKEKLPCTFEGCTRVFRCQTLLDDHLNRHNGVVAFNCESCNQNFVSRAQFAVHLRKYHNTSIRAYDKSNNAEIKKGKIIFDLSRLEKTVESEPEAA